jgi:hypothetical protein
VCGYRVRARVRLRGLSLGGKVRVRVFRLRLGSGIVSRFGSKGNGKDEGK